MLVAIQFPRDLMVGDRREREVGNLDPRFPRSPFLMNRVEVPVDLRAVVERFVAEQPEAVATDFVCLADDGGSLLREQGSQQTRALLCLRLIDEEMSMGGN